MSEDVSFCIFFYFSFFDLQGEADGDVFDYIRQNMHTIRDDTVRFLIETSA